MYKLLPTILRDFEFDMHLNGNKEWSVWAGWFQHQRGIWSRVRRRREKVEGEKVCIEIPEGGWRGE